VCSKEGGAMTKQHGDSTDLDDEKAEVFTLM
jgi:hypothetical protein